MTKCWCLYCAYHVLDGTCEASPSLPTVQLPSEDADTQDLPEHTNGRTPRTLVLTKKLRLLLYKADHCPHSATARSSLREKRGRTRIREG
jgi:hypothetical protein